MKSIAALAICLASPAFASQCAEQPPERIAQTAQIAFVGTVVAVQESTYKPRNACWAVSKQSPQCGGKLVTLQVTEGLRGATKAARVNVVAEDGCYCLGSYWEVGKAYLVVARRNDTGLAGDVVADNFCGGTGELNERTEPIVKALRGPRP